jgi:hypothetical protein
VRLSMCIVPTQSTSSSSSTSGSCRCSSMCNVRAIQTKVCAGTRMYAGPALSFVGNNRERLVSIMLRTFGVTAVQPSREASLAAAAAAVNMPNMRCRCRKRTALSFVVCELIKAQPVCAFLSPLWKVRCCQDFSS